MRYLVANYKITLHVEGARKESVEKALRKAFGEDIHPFTVEKVKTAESRGSRLSDAGGLRDEARDIVNELKDEMQEWYDSIPENLQNGDKANEVQEAIDALESLDSELENVDFDSVSFPGMFG
jgi:hypothetical protein